MSHKLLLIALMISVLSYSTQGLPQELFLFATYRDFLPAACLHEKDNEGKQLVENAWSNDGKLNKKGRCKRLLNNNLWKGAIERGEIIGHPDFEASGFFSIQNTCDVPDPTTGLFFPVGTCIFEFNDDGNGFKHSVVGRELKVGQNGIPKPQYCDDSEEEETRCGETGNKQTQTQKKYFDLWYNDDDSYNKRIGHRLQLNLGSGQNANQYSFESANDKSAVDFPKDAISNFFGPLNMFRIKGSREVKLKVSPEDAPAWPQTDTDSKLGKKGFSFTTELHTTFEFQTEADMRFTFSGDDDFWAFVNGQLAVDVGGMHEAVTRTVDLNEDVDGKTIAQELGLRNGEVYTLDIFHAERQSVGSNFALETTLFAACNVLQSGKPSFDFITERKSDLDEKFISRGITINDDETITLQKIGDTFTSSFIFSRQQENVLRGFDARFLAKISKDDTIGFAFVLQAAGIDDFPLVSGESFNIEGLQNSLAVVFDLCTDRGSDNCKHQEVRLHHADDANLGNSPKDRTKRVSDRILRNLKRDEAFPVQIIYFGGKPDFLEVYVNNSLYLRQDKFGQIIENLEIEGAHVGFTATNGNLAADITIENFVFNTVQVEPSLTIFTSELSAEVEPLTADGIDVSEGIQIKTFDFCGNSFEAGTLEKLVDAVFTEQPDEAGNFFNTTAHNEPALVKDNGDGTYQISLITEFPGNYSLVVAFGDGCEIDFNQNNEPRLVSTSGITCFFESYNEGNVVTQAFPPDIAPTVSPVEVVRNVDDQAKILFISSVAGGVSLLGLCASVAFFGFMRKWNKKKRFVKPGNQYRLDLNTVYAPNDEYKVTGKKLLETQQEILALQAASKVDRNKAVIQKLRNENDQMKEAIRLNKNARRINSQRSRANEEPKARRFNKMEF